MFHGRLLTLCSSLGVPSGLVPLPLEAQEAILGQCMALLGAEAPFLQLTNQPASPLPAGKLGLRAERAAHVWKNLPPSFIWRYRRGGA